MEGRYTGNSDSLIKTWFTNFKICLLVFYFRERDHDKDGKLSFSEFEHEFYDLVRLYDEESLHKDANLDGSTRRESDAKRKFSELDKNKDGQVLCYWFPFSLLYKFQSKIAII